MDEEKITEKVLEREGGGSGIYQPDLKKRYKLKNDEWKYDSIPEIWEGKNISDFVDPNILDKLLKIEKEEKERLKNDIGKIDWLHEDYFVPKEEVEKYEKIQEKAILYRKKKALKTAIRPSIARKNRTVPIEEIEKELKDRGFDDETLEKAKESNRSLSRTRSSKSSSLTRARSVSEVRSLLDSKQREPEEESLLGKRKRTLSSNSRSLSVTGKHSGISNPRSQIKAIEAGHKKQKMMNRLAKKGEADRVIHDLMPKHLYTGKRTVGKNDRR